MKKSDNFFRAVIYTAFFWAMIFGSYLGVEKDRNDLISPFLSSLLVLTFALSIYLWKSVINFNSSLLSKVKLLGRPMFNKINLIFLALANSIIALEGLSILLLLKFTFFQILIELLFLGVCSFGLYSVLPKIKGTD